VRIGRTGGPTQGADPGAVAGGEPGGMGARSHNGRPVRATVLAAPAGAARRPPLPADGHRSARCGRLQAPRGVPAAIGERFGHASFVMRPLAMVVTSLRPDGWKRLTARRGSRSRQRRGMTSGESALSSIFDRASTQSDQIELANLWQTAVEGARPCNRPGAGPGLTCGFVWSPPPESNRRPHPYHGTTGNRCADRRLRRSRPTVGAEVKRSLNAQLCVLLYSRKR
jgi:hypothetical protein